MIFAPKCENKNIVFLWDEGGFDCVCIGWKKGNTVGLRVVDKRRKLWQCPFCRKWQPVADQVLCRRFDLSKLKEIL